ncbi:MAG: HlyD family efflux transporter periplasmic adaptor subunit [Defluviitaleaceae bacterium]|nr:HlyD family efflux transporter periplasmic adaptor subunit [Defluviitaleaceae bacterium]
MKKHVKYILLAVIIICAAVGGGVYYTLPLSVRMVEVVPQTAELNFTEQGTVRTGRAVLVFPAFHGEISQIFVAEGQAVSAGEPLVSVKADSLILRLEQVNNGIRGLEAQLENVEIEAENTRSRLNSTLQSLRGELRAVDAQANMSGMAFANQQEVYNEQIRLQQVVIASHENELARVSETLERTEILYEGGVVPLVELTSARTAVSVAQANLEAANTQLAVIVAGAGVSDTEHFEGIRASLTAQIEGLNAQLSQDSTAAARALIESQIAVEQLTAEQLRQEIANAVITAPVDGIITTLHAQNTNMLSAATPVAEITTSGETEIHVYVSTQDINSIKVGDSVNLTLRQRAEDIHFSGVVTEIENAAVVRFTALGVEERKVGLRILPQIAVDEGGLGLVLGDGFAVDVTFSLFREEGRLIVPRTAVFKADGRDMVWIVDGGRARAAYVVTGMELRTDVIIESGVEVGQVVVVNANNEGLRDGVRVVRE